MPLDRSRRRCCDRAAPQVDAHTALLIWLARRCTSSSVVAGTPACLADSARASSAFMRAGHRAWRGWACVLAWGSSFRCHIGGVRRVRSSLTPDGREECDAMDERARWRALRGAPRPPAGGRPTGCSARSARPTTRVQETWLRLSRSDAGGHREPRRLADDGRGPGLPQHAALARGTRARTRSTCTCPTRSSTARTASTPSTRRCWPTRSASPCSWCSTRCRRPSGWRSCSTTCSPCRSTRSRRSSSARPAATRQLASRARRRVQGAPRARHRPCPAARGGRRLPRRVARRRLRRARSRCSTPTSCCAPSGHAVSSRSSARPPWRARRSRTGA